MAGIPRNRPARPPVRGTLSLVHRVLTSCLVLLALTGVVSGNLLRPCDCSGEDGIDSNARCQSMLLSSQAPSGGCPACHGRAHSPGPVEGEDGSDDEGCTLCCKPRAPLGEADGSVALDAPGLSFGAIAVGAPTPLVEQLHPNARALERARRTSDPWLLSPEGLAVFLI